MIINWLRSYPVNHPKQIDAKGVKTSLLQVPRCCHLKYGEPAVGYKSKDRHVIIHHCNCENIRALPENKLVELGWKEAKKQLISLMIEIVDRIGIFADILNTLTSQMLRVESVNTKTTRNKLYLNFEVSGITGLAQQEELVKKLKSLRNVVSVKLS